MVALDDHAVLSSPFPVILVQKKDIQAAICNTQYLQQRRLISLLLILPVSCYVTFSLQLSWVLLSLFLTVRRKQQIDFSLSREWQAIHVELQREPRSNEILWWNSVSPPPKRWSLARGFSIRMAFSEWGECSEKCSEMGSLIASVQNCSPKENSLNSLK